MNIPEDMKLAKIEHIGRFTIAQVIDTIGRNGVGVSRRSFLDKINETRGDNIAVGRACSALKKKMTKRPIFSQFMG